MIVGVPEHTQLVDTAVGWLNLAWATAINELIQFQEFQYQFEDIEKEHGKEIAQKEIERYWTSVNFTLNNSVSLFQQSIELFLKARIAEVSPFLLITSDPQSWPKPNSDGDIDFSDFRTIDAVNLIRTVTAVSPHRLPPNFPSFFDRVRRTRNKIAHLHAGQWRVEVKAVLLDILAGYHMLHPDVRWLEFRKQYFVSESLPIDLYKVDDFSHTQVMRELRACIAEFEPRHLTQYFSYNSRKRTVTCPHCMELRSEWDDETPEFVQRQKDGGLRCVVCATSYSSREYAEAMEQWDE